MPRPEVPNTQRRRTKGSMIGGERGGNTAAEREIQKEKERVYEVGRNGSREWRQRDMIREWEEVYDR